MMGLVANDTEHNRAWPALEKDWGRGWVKDATFDRVSVAGNETPCATRGGAARDGARLSWQRHEVMAACKSRAGACQSFSRK